MWVYGLIALGVYLLMPKRRVPPNAPRADVEQAIKKAARKYGIDEWFAMAMADKESGFRSSGQNTGNPRREMSYGIFQINWNVHGEVLTRRGLTREDLYDPSINADYWGEITSDILARCKRLFGGDDVFYATRYALAGATREGERGVDQSDLDAPQYAYIRRNFAPYVAKWKERYGVE